jgi:ATP-dependent DNA helicase RecG
VRVEEVAARARSRLRIVDLASDSDDLLATPLQFLKGVGPRRAADLARAGLATVDDLLHRFPLRYEDRSRLQPIASIRPGPAVLVAGRVLSVGVHTTRRPGFKVFEALIGDESGAIRAAWLNQPYLRDVFVTGQRVMIFGAVELNGTHGLQLTNPQYEIVDESEGETIHIGRIVPVYEKTGSVTSKIQRKVVHEALERLPSDLADPLPDAVRQRHSWPARQAALVAVHFPPSDASLDELNRFATAAQQRLIFEEAFAFQVGLLARRREWALEPKQATIEVNDRIRASVRAALPFRLTMGQRQALKEIVDDLRRPHAMNRLLQGDVGAGKTIVALLASLVAMENGLQVAFMAPTEILSEQHYLTISKLLQGSRFTVTLLTGGRSAAGRAGRAAIERGDVHLIVGTHALVQRGVTFQRLGLVIIDEQHRFGVLQRATLRTKGARPDVLVMTATPIPRTLALTMYGDLDVSVIRDRPPGRLPVKTTAKPDSTREDVYGFVRDQIAAGRQAYVVFPLVEESDKIDVRAAIEMADHFAQDVFPSLRVGLLHGRLKAEVRNRVMQAFAAGDIDILVSTTVIEVGVDVANASVMIVEHAERFGLSQLHQLRGRVGRGRHQSYCCLLYQAPMSDAARGRLTAMTDTTDGFEIAERDLALRGPGDFFGTRQAGAPTFRLIDLVRDHQLVARAQRAAADWLAATAPGRMSIQRLLDRWATRFQLIDVA